MKTRVELYVYLPEAHTEQYDAPFAEHSPHARRSARTWYPFGQPPA